MASLRHPGTRHIDEALEYNATKIRFGTMHPLVNPEQLRPKRDVLPRYASLDFLKASAIVTIVWIHSFQVIGEPSPAPVQRLAFLARYGVPAFLFASGFLLERGSVRWQSGLLSARLVRILVPYAIASAVAILYRALAWHVSFSGAQIAFELLTGSACGIYYFVPVLVGALVAVLALFRGHIPVLPVFLVFLVGGLLSEMNVIRLDLWFWNLRNPLRWWGYFFAGWVAAQHVLKIEAAAPAHRRRLAAALLGLTAVSVSVYAAVLVPGWSRAAAVLNYLAIYGLTLGIFLGSWDLAPGPAVRLLSDATYPVYLYHWFFVDIARRLTIQDMYPRHALSFVLGLAGSFALVSVGRRVLGTYARLVIG